MSIELSYWDKVTGEAYHRAIRDEEELDFFDACFRIAKNEGVGVKFGRAVIALPSAAINLLAKPILHLALASLFLLSTLWGEKGNGAIAKMYMAFIVKDLKEGIGDLTTLFSDGLGMYWKAQAAFCKELYEKMANGDGEVSPRRLGPGVFVRRGAPKFESNGVTTEQEMLEELDAGTVTVLDKGGVLQEAYKISAELRREAQRAQFDHFIQQRQPRKDFLMDSRLYQRGDDDDTGDDLALPSFRDSQLRSSNRDAFRPQIASSSPHFTEQQDGRESR